MALTELKFEDQNHDVFFGNYIPTSSDLDLYDFSLNLLFSTVTLICFPPFYHPQWLFSRDTQAIPQLVIIMLTYGHMFDSWMSLCSGCLAWYLAKHHSWFSKGSMFQMGPWFVIFLSRNVPFYLIIYSFFDV
jgi:hypothetical protein